MNHHWITPALVKAVLVLKCLIVVSFFLWSGRWFADYYVAKRKRPDRWRTVFLGVSLVPIICEIVAAGVLFWLL